MRERYPGERRGVTLTVPTLVGGTQDGMWVPEGPAQYIFPREDARRREERVTRYIQSTIGFSDSLVRVKFYRPEKMSEVEAGTLIWDRMVAAYIGDIYGV